jgi:hypothetical protein
MNILVDSQHHPALDESIEILFHDRLGHDVFRPIGIDWASEGVWDWKYPDGSMPWIVPFSSSFCNPSLGDGIYKKKIEQYSRYYNYITFSGAKKIKIDLIISTLRTHDVRWLKYIQENHPTTKLVAQIGDVAPIDERVEYIICSIPGYIPFKKQELIYYNQEFDIKNIFFNELYKNYNNPKIIRSFVHYFASDERFVDSENIFLKYEKALLNYKFFNYSKTGRDGFVTDMALVGRLMRESLFGWQVKPIEGYGHNLHNWLAVGRPVIINTSAYKHHSNLLVPGYSCIDVDAQSFDKTIRLIEECSIPSVHKKMCEETHKIFTENVNFDKDAENIKDFIGRML